MQLRSRVAVLWLLWCRPSAIALILSLAWEPPYAMGAALKKEKKKSSHCGAMELVSSWQRWDTGLIPGLAR